MSITKGTRENEHEHELELKSYNKLFTCDGCKMEGFGSRYKCELCDYELHKECGFPKPAISHEFFEGCTFEFHLEPLTKCGESQCKSHARICDACGKDIYGYVYHCRAEGWDLHPCCSNLESRLFVDGTDFVLRDRVLSKCLWCKKKRLWGNRSRIPGWSYVSDGEKYHFHVYCITKMVHEAWKKGGGDESSVALEKMELRAMAKANGKGGRGGEFWRTLRIFLRTIVGIIFGDPTTTLAYVLVQLLTN